MKRFEASLRDMIRHGRGNQWLKFEKSSVYVRVGGKMLPPGTVPGWSYRATHNCVQIASIVTEPKYQHKGSFTRMIKKIQRITNLPIYVEQVLNTEFRDALLRHGFVPARSYEGELLDVVLPRLDSSL